MKPSQSGHLREATRAPPSSATLQYGGPPTASIPKIHDQPEELSSKRFRPSGNNASTGISPVPPTRQQIRGATSGRQRTVHLDAGTTIASARTKNPNVVPAGRPHPADSTPQLSNRGAPNTRLHSTRRQDSQHAAGNPALLSDQGPGSARPNGVCPRFAAGRAAVWVSAPRGSGGRRLLN